MAKTAISVKGVWYGEDIIDGMEFELQEAFLKSAKRIAANAKSRVVRSDLPITPDLIETRRPILQQIKRNR